MGALSALGAAYGKWRDALRVALPEGTHEFFDELLTVLAAFDARLSELDGNGPITKAPEDPRLVFARCAFEMIEHTVGKDTIHSRMAYVARCVLDTPRGEELSMLTTGHDTPNAELRALAHRIGVNLVFHDEKGGVC